MGEKLAVVEAADTSLALLYQLSSKCRKASPELAGRIAKAIGSVRRKKGEKPLPVVLRGDISEVCGGCSYYLKECK